MNHFRFTARRCFEMVLLLPLCFGATVSAGEVPDVVIRELVCADAPFPEFHASTLAETAQGLVIAWFGGTREKDPDVGIWLTRQVEGVWLAPVEVANGLQHVRTDGTEHRHPTWNPVLFQYPSGPLVLFWKCGPSPSTWWGMMAHSDDGGQTWSPARRLPEHIDGPVRNKPLLTADGILLCGSSTEFDGWRVHFEMTRDHGATWMRTPAIHDGQTVGAIQPTLMRLRDGTIQALCRNQNGEGTIVSTRSSDGGKTWSNLVETDLPNPNSGIDAVTLTDGRQLLIYNHTHRRSGTPRGREMLNVAVSDDGVRWQAALILENEAQKEFSYPAVIQTQDGLVHLTYTWKRKNIAHVVLQPAKLTLRDFEKGKWPGL